MYAVSSPSYRFISVALSYCRGAQPH